MKLDADLIGAMIWLGESIDSTKNTQKAVIMERLAKQVYDSFVKGQPGAKDSLLGAG